MPLKPQTIEGREKNPKKGPGPQEYFKEDKFDGKKGVEFKREKGEKRIYKPNMNNYVF